MLNFKHPCRLATIILAAGASQRFGEPKQLALFNGETFLRRAVKSALGASCGEVFVILGSDAELLSSEIVKMPVQIVINQAWQRGMMSSLHAGLRKALEVEPNLEGIIVMLCDQPLVDSTLIKNLADIFSWRKKLIVACEYEGTVGVPAVFSSLLFEEIFELSGKGGAKALIKKYELQTEKVPAPQAALDIDTPNDYESLLSLFLPKSGG